MAGEAAAMLAYFDRPDAFTARECDAIVALGGAGALEQATVFGEGGDQVDPRMRQAERCYWSREIAGGWIHERLDALFAEAGERFGLAVDPVFEGIQFVRYDVGGHFRIWHSDAGADRHEARLISVSVELSEAGDYDGGVLEIAPAVGMPRTLPRGGARLFPSRAIHRVTPVTRGVRHALVAWTGKLALE
jgi:PKHD-type hydroxylase